jgi:hypothetical protein
MRKVSVLLRAMSVPMLAGCMIFPAATGALAQNADAQRKPRVITPTEADAAAARQSKTVFMKAWTGARPKTVPESKLIVRGTSERTQAKSDESDGSSDNFVRVPGHLSYFGGPTVETAESHNIYLAAAGCSTPACYGDPETFLRDLGKSEFMHITDQYVHRSASNRYTFDGSVLIPFTVDPNKPLTDTDIQTFVHAVTSATGEAGYTHIYHVFIPPLQDECLRPGVCASNVFCAYHSSVDFTDGTHVLYTVEPFADVLGCQVRPNTPNGRLTDSTNTVLSHELVETITDPDGSAWFDITSGGMLGEEIGDECVFLVLIGPNLFSDPVTINVNDRKWALQPEYNNRAQACTAER